MSRGLLRRHADRSGGKTYEHLLEVNDLHLSFRGVKAIDGVSFHVDDGELFAIIGPNGAGKTSLFNSINQVYRYGAAKGSLESSHVPPLASTVNRA